MSDFAVYDLSDAPEAAVPFLESAEKRLGFVPTILGAMAEAPATLEGYVTLSGILDRSSLSPSERQIILLAISRENDCQFCVAAHSGGARKAGVDADTVEAAREGQTIADAKLNALRDFAVAMTINRGQASAEELSAFLDAGYTKQQAFEVILAISVKVLTNYVDALAEVPLNKQLEPLRWVAPSKRAAE